MDPDPSATQRRQVVPTRSPGRTFARLDLDADIVAELEVAGLEAATEIGRGGFGTVYRCFQSSLERSVAVKVLAADLDEENLERFLREEHAMGRLSGHPNIVDILAIGATSSGRPYILMPFHARGSLERAVQRSGPMQWTDAVRIGIKLAGAIESAHWMGILHRDVKPANVLITAYDEPQLTDFGIARVPGAFETASGAITGSPAYIAPEVMAGNPPTELSDVYGLGATIFTLVTGHAAFERHAGEGVMAHFLRVSEQPVPDLRILNVPRDVSAAIEAAMAPQSSDRPRTAAEFGQLLQRVEFDHGVSPEKMALPADVEHEHAGPHSYASRRRTVATAPQPPIERRREGPVPRAGELRRSRLLADLRASRAKVVSIVAPAGYGKSLLAAQWRDALVADGEDVDWVHVRADGHRAPEHDLHQHGGAGSHGGAGTLFIDGYDRIRDAAVRDAISRLLEGNGPDVVITSRTAHPKPVHECLEIGADELRFDAAEAEELLLRIHGLPLSTAEAADLAEATRGWATALQLVAVALRGGTDRADSTAPHVIPGAAARAAKAIRRVRGGDEAVAGFLIDNLLNSVEPRMSDFLRSTAASDQPMLSGNPEMLSLLESAERRNLFVRRIHPDGWSEVVSPLVGDLLRRSWERTAKHSPSV